MSHIETTRTIDAPINLVFKTIAHIEEFSKAVPHIKEVEFLTDSTTGAGTRFRETRVMDGREATTELEVVDYVQNEMVRIVSDTAGTVWDTVFRVSTDNGQTRLDMAMDIRPHSLLARLTTPFIRGMIIKAIENDMDSVKTFCEHQSHLRG